MPSSEVDKTKGESILNARHTNGGQSGVEQWLVPGLCFSSLLHSSQQDFSGLSKSAAETDAGKPVSITVRTSKTTEQAILKEVIRMVLFITIHKPKVNLHSGTIHHFQEAFWTKGLPEIQMRGWKLEIKNGKAGSFGMATAFRG